MTLRPLAIALLSLATVPAAFAVDKAASLTEPQVRELLTKQGYTRIDDLEFEDGMWETDATSADGNRVDLRVDASGKVFAEDVVSNLTAEDVKAKITAAGYSKVHDVDYDDGVWKADAERDDGKNIDSGRYAASIRTIHKVGRQVAAFFADHDILLSPTMAAPPKPLGVLSQSNPNSQEYLGHLLQTIGFTQLMNVAGNPAMSVPLAWSKEKLPIGIQFAAPFGDEARLFRLAGQLEQARPWADRRPEI